MEKETLTYPSNTPTNLNNAEVELVIHAQANPDTAHEAVSSVADELGVSKEALRVWVRKHKDTGLDTPTQSVDLEVENRRLRAELAEAKRANDILKRPQLFVVSGVRAPTKVVVAFIDKYRAQFGITPIVRALRNTSAKIAP